ncbi:MAG: fumarate hydratase C-terminal domain-containing protein [Thioalkalivibrio sp.]|nr:fumarate hydratase C-terminal domain-containing protein [Thioalkalivibrio sp.]
MARCCAGRGGRSCDATWNAADPSTTAPRLRTPRHRRRVGQAQRAHHRELHRGDPLPVDFTGRVIYYVGPVDPVRDEAVGPAGPTTATRMDRFTRTMLEQTGLIAMIGKGERGPAAIDAIRENRSAYLIAVGGAAYLVAKAIRSAQVVAFEDLGMEAIYEFEVRDMPVTVAVDSEGTSVHITGPREWRARIGRIPVALA